MKIDRHLVISSEKQSGASSPLERVASYFKDLAVRGLGCASNNVTVGQHLGLSVEQVRAAKQRLISLGRLTGRWGVWQAIDGWRFGTSRYDELEALKTALRKHRFSPVCDARIVDQPGRVPKGMPTHLIVGLRRMSVEEAVDLAERLEEKSK